MNALTSILVVCALLGFAVCLLARFWKPISAVMDRFLGLPPFEKVVVVVLLAVATVSAQKGGTNALGPSDCPQNARRFSAGTPMLGMSGPRRVQSPPVCSGVTARPDVTPEDVARGWQIVVNTNACYSYAMPGGAVLQSNWWLRGAYEDVARLELGEPYGSFWAFTWGKVRRHLRDASNELAAVGAPMSAVPNASRLWWGVGADDSRLVTWESFFLNRDTNTPVNAQIELRRNGDYVLRSNEIERVFRQINLDDWDDDGVPNDIDEHPYQAVDLVGQSDEERARINSAVGFGQENGYYRFAASFPDELDRAVRLTVGTNSIVVKAAGEYYFLLEKGVGYSIEVTPFCADVTYSAVDDIVPDTMMMLQSLWGGLLEWTVDGDSWELRYPGVGTLGYCAWWPKFQGSPSVGHLGPGGGPYVFTAEFTDYRHAEDVAYHWTSGDPNVIIVSPNAQETEVRFAEMPSWQSTTLSVTAQTSQRTYRSDLLGVTYGTNDTPQVHLSLSVPSAVLLNSNQCSRTKLRRMGFGYSPDVATNGTVRLRCVSGSGKIALWADAQMSTTVSADRSWDASSPISYEAYIEGIETSESVGDVQFVAEFISDNGDGQGDAESLTVVQVGEVTLPGAPDDGLIILRGESVGLKVDCLPDGAESLLSTIWQTCRMRGNGTYDEWTFAAGNYVGNTAIYTPPVGGIYQVRVLAGVGGEGVDERHYVWKGSENHNIGKKRRRMSKAFGVCDELWQRELRNCAKAYLGDGSYGYNAQLDAQYDYPQVPAERDKCNIFVAHRLAQCGMRISIANTFLRRWPPVANEWGDPDFQIIAWKVISISDYPRPGMIAVKPSPETIGHVGILDFDGMVLSAQHWCVTRISDITLWHSVVIRTRNTEE